MSGWDALDTAIKETGGSGTNTFINLDNGESVTGVLVGQPHLAPIFWTGSTYVPWIDSEREADDKKSFQLSMNFYDIESRKMRVLQGKTALMISLQEVTEKYGRPTGKKLASGKDEKELNHRVFEVKRTGEKAQTRFPLLLEPDIKVPTKEEMGELHDLVALATRGKGGDIRQDNTGEAKPATDDGLPF